MDLNVFRFVTTTIFANCDIGCIILKGSSKKYRVQVGFCGENIMV